MSALKCPLLNKYPLTRPSLGKPKCGAVSTRAASQVVNAAAVLPKNLIGIHSGVFVGDWRPEDAERAVKGAKEAGFDLIELNLSVPEEVDADLTKKVLRDYELQASGSLGLSRATDISSSDTEIRRNGIKLLSNALKALNVVGGKYFIGVNFGAMDKYREPLTAEQWKHCVASLKEVASEAADYGIEYGLEVVNRYETNILNTAQQAKELVGDIGLDNVTIHLDTYHMNIEENSMEQAIQAAGNKLGYIHIGESHRGYLGTGSVDFTGLFRGLAASGYTGPLTFESFSSAVVSPSLSNTLCVWRDLWDDPDDLAVKAHGFIESNWAAAYQLYSRPKAWSKPV
ncbi:xylose isomerase domain-containing protein [Coccomyxa subellipsoidea C-169]|uniref:Xylose isomerase domain-containing protein n=1 Tax=Coccomyxa subellipsoidea (strain C-169) TaxID=574566 RepID=I0Z1M9_COCSC|nr:xylose isomerase domain-containing protein [Coccomyxa subellipsoidea C-169]EIE24548.1 xylose isomerase domain-containing protein [Coccomyxa subellipsoidea C-169]|eukprot:XP_005649092.1 xylose isomerase domain-containing protein [Coccomyxa subellipsoidea C-169]